MAPASRPEAEETLEARSVDGAVQLAVRVIPRASRNAIVGVRRGALCVRLQAPPVEGAANRALIRFLGKRLGVPPRAVSLVRGDTGRDKLLRIEGVALADVERLAGRLSVEHGR
jgi:uncharacterized protein (TIGR00251 family)